MDLNDIGSGFLRFARANSIYVGKAKHAPLVPKASICNAPTKSKIRKTRQEDQNRNLNRFPHLTNAASGKGIAFTKEFEEL